MVGRREHTLEPRANILAVPYVECCEEKRKIGFAVGVALAVRRRGPLEIASADDVVGPRAKGIGDPPKIAQEAFVDEVVGAAQLPQYVRPLIVDLRAELGVTV